MSFWCEFFTLQKWIQEGSVYSALSTGVQYRSCDVLGDRSTLRVKSKKREYEGLPGQAEEWCFFGARARLRVRVKKGTVVGGDNNKEVEVDLLGPK